MAIDALKVESSISTPSSIVAGSPFTITTILTNVHDDTIEVLEYCYYFPYQVQWIDENSYMTAYDEYKALNILAKLFSKSPWRHATQPPGIPMIYSIRPQNGQSLAKGSDTIYSVLSGEKAIYSFEAVVPNWLFITGREIKFEGRVRYRYNGEEHTSQFNVGFTMRPPLISNILGAIIGGILGTTAQFLKENKTYDTFDLSFISSSALSIILGIIIVVFSSRKTSDVQPILTIEDIWGGMLAGFFVGYLGHDFFGKIVNINI